MAVDTGDRRPAAARLGVWAAVTAVVAQWVIPAAYLAGWFFTMTRVATAITESDARKELERRKGLQRRCPSVSPEDDGEPLVSTEDRLMNTGLGFAAGMVWPLSLLVLAIARSLRVPTEIAEDERRELAALRKLAREHGLPMPEVKP